MDKIEAKDRLIIALDLLDVDEARRMVDRLGDTATFYKVGLSLQLASGVEGLVHDLISRGKKVFLDYKYYDVQETLRKAVSQAARLGVSFLTVHGTGDLLKAAVSGKGNSNLKPCRRKSRSMKSSNRQELRMKSRASKSRLLSCRRPSSS